MGKKNKGFDVIAEAHERANNNINPYYWMNRVTLYKLAQWRVDKMLSPVFFVLYSITGYVVLSVYSEIATKQDQSLLAFCLILQTPLQLPDLFSFSSCAFYGLFLE